jgi:hypothetical protein
VPDNPLYKSSVETLDFNRKHGTFYTDEELARRKKQAEPYKLFMLLGGAEGNATLIGNYHVEWYTLYRKAVQALGTDDQNTIDDWIRKQYNRIMGLEDIVAVDSHNALGDVPQHSAEGPTLLGRLTDA